MLRLPVVAELGDCARLAVGDEDRVEAEACGAACMRCDPALQRSRPTALFAGWAEGDELAHVSRPPRIAVRALEPPQHPADLVPGGAPGGMDARASAQAGDFDAGVFAEHPERRRRELAPEPRLRQSVVVVRGA